MLDLAAGQSGSVLYCDKGLWGKELRSSLELMGVKLITPESHRICERPPVEVEKARTRRVIELVFVNLKYQMRLREYLAKIFSGLVLRLAQRPLALTLGVYLNVLAGRSARALATNDGRATHIKPL